jgi:hypothetical protein
MMPDMRDAATPKNLSAAQTPNIPTDADCVINLHDEGEARQYA